MSTFGLAHNLDNTPKVEAGRHHYSSKTRTTFRKQNIKIIRKQLLYYAGLSTSSLTNIKLV
jgi:hypothetical protein